MESPLLPVCPGCRDRDRRLAELEARVLELEARVLELEAKLRDLMDKRKPPME